MTHDKLIVSTSTPTSKGPQNVTNDSRSAMHRLSARSVSDYLVTVIYITLSIGKSDVDLS